MDDPSGQTRSLEETTCEKDLGVLIDNKLTFKNHISTSAKKANSILGLIRRTFKHLDAHNLPQLYKTIVRPIIEYGNSVWWPVQKQERVELEKIQHGATKLIPELRNLKYEDRLRQLNIPTIAYRHLRGDMINVYKYATNKYKTHLLNFDTNSTTRSNGFKLNTQRCNTTKYQKSFTNRVTAPWNSLPANVVESPSVNIFKNRLDKLWMKHPLKFNPESKTSLPPQHRLDYVL